MWQVVKVHPCGPTYQTHDIRVLCEDNEGGHAQRVGCIAVFIVLDFDLGLAREPTARAMYQGQCPPTISSSIGKRDGEHALRRLS